MMYYIYIYIYIAIGRSLDISLPDPSRRTYGEIKRQLLHSWGELVDMADLVMTRDDESELTMQDSIQVSLALTLSLSR